MGVLIDAHARSLAFPNDASIGSLAERTIINGIRKDVNFQRKNRCVAFCPIRAIIMIDRSARVKNNLSEQLKLFYDYTKDVPTRVIKPNPLPA